MQIDVALLVGHASVEGVEQYLPYRVTAGTVTVLTVWTGLPSERAVGGAAGTNRIPPVLFWYSILHIL
jgi:hypothetical protein